MLGLSIQVYVLSEYFIRSPRLKGISRIGGSVFPRRQHWLVPKIYIALDPQLFSPLLQSIFSILPGVDLTNGVHLSHTNHFPHYQCIHTGAMGCMPWFAGLVPWFSGFLCNHFLSACFLSAPHHSAFNMAPVLPPCPRWIWKLCSTTQPECSLHPEMKI